MNLKNYIKSQKKVIHLLFPVFLGKKYQMEIASISPNYSKFSLAVETTQMGERFLRSDVNSFVRQVYGKYSTSLRHANHSTLIRRKNFSFQIFLYCMIIKAFNP